jgi:Lrp/AsnC family transcriptional regulator
VDATDRKILEILQRDASSTVAEIGRAVGLSPTPCWKRIQKLEAEGIIRKRVALLAREKLGLGVTVQVFVQAGDHAPETVAAFVDKVREMPEVLELHRLAGDFDFFLRVVAVDVRHYDAIYQRLTSLMTMRRVTSYFELAQLKSETALPLGFDEPAPLSASA